MTHVLNKNIFYLFLDLFLSEFSVFFDFFFASILGLRVDDFSSDNLIFSNYLYLFLLNYCFTSL